MEPEDFPELHHPPSPPSRPERALPLDDESSSWVRRRRVIWIYFPIFVLLLAAAAGVIVGSSIKRPEVDTLDSFVPKLVTTLYDRQMQPVRTYQRENRILLQENEISDNLKFAILAAEDSNFYQHGGIDLKGVARAVVTNVLEGRRAEGASTLSMQLARELFLTREKKWKRKIEEAFLAVELEKKYSKPQILALYCNLVNLSQGNYGMEAAARNYFNKTVGELTIAEAATLAGIPQRPTSYNVYKNPELVTRRRNLVIGRMLAEGYIDQETHDAAVAEPLLVVPKRREETIGAYFNEEVRRYLAQTYGTTALYDRGLQVETTLDRNIQRAAETALRDGLLSIDHGKRWRGAPETLEDEELEERKLPDWTDQPIIPGEWYKGIVLESGPKTATVKIQQQTLELTRAGIGWTRKSRPNDVLQRGDVAWFRLEAAEKEGDPPTLMLEQEPEIEAAVVVLESATGAVRAMVGGWDYNRNEFNRATQAMRQVGSAFKPFVAGAAFENGFTPADVLFDGPAIFPGAPNQPGYSPRNYYRKYYGITTLRQVIEDSINVSSVKLLDLIGVEQVIDFARRAGITSDLPPYPSLALGAASMTPLELAGAYATFVNQGIHVEPYLIERVTSREGRVLQEHLPRASKAMEPEIAYLLTRVLQGVTRGGTAAAGLRGIDLAMAGKTGTTNSYTDAWFAGFTPQFTILVWVGHDKNKPIGRGMTGAAAALPIWRDIVVRGLDEEWIEPVTEFSMPPGVVEVEVERATGLRYGPGAPSMYKEVFIQGTEPEQKYDLSWARIMTLPWYLQEPFYVPKEGERMPGQIEDWTPVTEAWTNTRRKPGDAPSTPPQG